MFDWFDFSFCPKYYIFRCRTLCLYDPTTKRAIDNRESDPRRNVPDSTVALIHEACLPIYESTLVMEQAMKVQWYPPGHLNDPRKQAAKKIASKLFGSVNKLHRNFS